MAAKESKVADPDVFGGAPEPATLTVTQAQLQAIVADQVRLALAAAPSAGAAQPDAMIGARALFEQMALSIAEMTHQTNRTHKPVDPKILAARRAGQDRLDEMLAKVHAARKAAADRAYDSEIERDAAIKAVTPKYRVISVCVFDDDIIVPYVRDPATKKSVPVEIYWAQEPNDALLPANEIAEAVHAAFRESRGQRSDIEKRSIKPAWMTENGLVIEGGTPPRRRDVEVPPVLRDLDLSAAAVRDGIDFVQVLGTKASPFQMNYQGKS